MANMVYAKKFTIKLKNKYLIYFLYLVKTIEKFVTYILISLKYIILNC